jgi:S1-C subfamily serine protease
VITRLAPLVCVALVALIPGQSVATPEVAQKAQRWTVRIETTAGQGSGVCDGKRIWTAAHCFSDHDEPGAKAKVKTVHGLVTWAKLAYIDRDRDLAVLDLPEGVSIDGPKWLKRDVVVGDRVYVAGSPQGDDGTVSAGIVSALARDVKSHWRYPLDQTDARAWYGNSGGGVYLQETGELVGILVAGKESGFCFFVRMAEMREVDRVMSSRLAKCCARK